MNNNLLDMDTRSKFGKAEILLICCMVFQLILYLLPVRYGDGYFCDELYQIAMSHHLCWGGVDVPPLTPFLLAVVQHLFGTSLYALRLLPMLFGAFTLYLTYLMVKELQGNFIAYFIALICITLEPMQIAISSIYTYDSLNRMIWVIMLYMILLLIKTDNKKYWIYLGIFAGLGMMTKWSVLFLGASIVVGLILTKRRSDLKSSQIWVGGVIALLIFSPYLIWNYRNGFPTFEFMSSWPTHHLSGSLTKYLAQMIVFTNLLSAPVWLLGAYYFLFNRDGKKYRMLGIVFLALLILVLYERPKFYLITSYLPVLYVGGSVLWGRCAEKIRIKYVLQIYIVCLIITGLLLVPLMRPILPTKTLAKCYRALISGKDFYYQGSGVLPQWFADRFGWQYLTKEVANIYNSLSTNEQETTVIFASNYSVAGAISFFGKKDNLPDAFSGHNQYFFWKPEKSRITTLIVVENNSLEHYKKLFGYVKHEGIVDSGYGRRTNIWLCRKPKFSIIEDWHMTKHFD